MPTLLTTSEAAAYAGVTPKSVRCWVRQGLLPAMSTPKGRCNKLLLIRQDHLDALKEQRAAGRQWTTGGRQPSVGAPLRSSEDFGHAERQRGLLAAAKQGDTQAIRTLRLPRAQGGYGVTELVLGGVRVI